MLTIGALPGEDGLHGTADDSLCADCDTMTVRMPAELMIAFEDSMGIDPTVGDVLVFANTSLGGGETCGLNGKTIWHAVANLDRAFKRARFLVSAEPDTIVPIVLDADGIGGERANVGSTSLSLVATRTASGAPALHLNLPSGGSQRR